MMPRDARSLLYAALFVFVAGNPSPARAQGVEVRTQDPAASKDGGTHRPDTEQPTGDDTRKQEILNKLSNLKIDLDFKDTPLDDVIDFIRDFAQINIVVDPRVHDQAGGDDLKISLKIHDLPLKSALKLLLGSKNLSAMYKEGVLLVLPKAEIQKSVTLRLYDVRDLLARIQDFPGPVVELKPPGQDGGAITGATFTLDEPKSIVTEEFIQEIIKKNTGGGDWDSNPNASMKLSNGILIVTQSPSVHAEIDRLLGKLRAFK